METQVIILRSLELIACVTGFACWRKIRTTFFKWFPVYLAFIVVSECIGQYLRSPEMQEWNRAYFNYFEIPIEFLFFFTMFYNARNLKRISMICGGLFLLSYLIDLLYFNKQEFAFYSFSYSIGNLLLLILILSYFINLVKSSEILNFWGDMLFWIGTGLLVYYLGTFPYYGLRNTLGRNYPNLYFTYSHIMYILNSLMYLMFTLSFIWGRPNTKSS